MLMSNVNISYLSRKCTVERAFGRSYIRTYVNICRDKKEPLPKKKFIQTSQIMSVRWHLLSLKSQCKMLPCDISSSYGTKFQFLFYIFDSCGRLAREFYPNRLGNCYVCNIDVGGTVFLFIVNIRMSIAQRNI